MKKLRFIILLTTILWLPLFAQTDASLQVEVKQTGGWVFYAPETPHIEISVKNTGNEKVNQNIRLTVNTDKRMPVYSFAQEVTITPHDSSLISFSFSLPAPGFYRCTVSNEEAEIRKFNIGYEPEAIVSLPDNQPDIDAFWETAKKELAAVAPDRHIVGVVAKSEFCPVATRLLTHQLVDYPGKFRNNPRYVHWDMSYHTPIAHSQPPKDGQLHQGTVPIAHA